MNFGAGHSVDQRCVAQAKAHHLFIAGEPEGEKREMGWERGGAPPAVGGCGLTRLRPAHLRRPSLLGSPVSSASRPSPQLAVSVN